MLFDKRKRASRRLKVSSEIAVSKLASEFFSKALNKSPEDIKILYRNYSRLWDIYSARINSNSKKEIVLHRDEFELVTKLAYRQYYEGSSKYRDKILRVIRILEGYPAIIYILRPLFYKISRKR